MSPGPRQELYRQEPISGRVRGVTFAEALYRQDSFPPSGAGEIGPSEGQEMDPSDGQGPSKLRDSAVSPPLEVWKVQLRMHLES